MADLRREIHWDRVKLYEEVWTEPLTKVAHVIGQDSSIARGRPAYGWVACVLLGCTGPDTARRV